MVYAEPVCTAAELAAYILKRCCKKGTPITNLRLQQILYIIQRYYLQHGRICFTDSFFAQGYGPSIMSVYYEYSNFGGMEINEFDLTHLCHRKAKKIRDPEDPKRINKLIDAYRTKEPWDIAKDICAKGKAWARTFRDGQGVGQIIPMKEIRKYG